MKYEQLVAARWTAYSSCTLLFLFLSTMLLGNVQILDVSPFLPPIIVAIAASFENEGYAHAVFGLCLGLCCDFLIHSPLPCLYTLSFTFAAWLSALLSRKLMAPGFFTSIVVSSCAFIPISLLSILTFYLRYQASLYDLAYLAIREILCSLIFVPLCFFCLRRVHYRFIS